MKKVILCLFLFFSLFTFIKGQEIIKNANVIIIKTSDNIDDAFKKIGRLLMNEGYDIESSDKTFYSIITKETIKKFGFLNGEKTSVKYYFQLDVKDNITIIKLWGKMERNNYIRNRGMKGSVAKATWDYMDDFAHKYENGKIEYLIDENKK